MERILCAIEGNGDVVDVMAVQIARVIATGGGDNDSVPAPCEF
jgi:hypothetical protein